MLKVTFDNNTFSPIVIPDRYPKHPAIEAVGKLRAAISEKHLLGYYSEAIFGVDLLSKALKANYLREAGLVSHWSSTSPTQATLSIGMKWGRRPEFSDGEKTRLEEASKLGMEALIGPRRLCDLLTIPGYALPHKTITDYVLHADKSAAIDRAISKKKLGRAKFIERCGQIPENTHWTKCLTNLSDKELKDGIGEWADADAIVAHYANDCDIFCTEDKASNSGRNSILHPNNRQWLEKEFGITFATISGLSELIECM